jgi:hypothetical protein
MWSFLSAKIPPMSPIIQLLGSGLGQPGSTTKLGAVAPAATCGAVRSANRSKAAALVKTSPAPVPFALALPPCPCCAQPKLPAQKTSIKPIHMYLASRIECLLIDLLCLRRYSANWIREDHSERCPKSSCMGMLYLPAPSERRDVPVKSERIARRFRNAVIAAIFITQQPPQPPTPLIQENATIKVSEHVYVIPDGNVAGVPNVGIVGRQSRNAYRGHGLGVRNGQTVLREMGNASKHAEIYIVATHFHSEHTLGESAFPSSAGFS